MTNEKPSTKKLVFYEDIRRMRVGSDADGRPITLHCSADPICGKWVSKFYKDRDEQPCGYGDIKQWDPALSSAHGIATLRLRYLRHFKSLKEYTLARAKLAYLDSVKYVRIGWTTDLRMVYAQCRMDWEGSEQRETLSLWKDTGKRTESGEPRVESICHHKVDTSRLVPEIHTKNHWQGAAINIWLARYGKPVSCDEEYPQRAYENSWYLFGCQICDSDSSDSEQEFGSVNGMDEA
ncbi:hypothetical protein BCR34DRAFT_592824 [Clohesyomyces aquaticus]|uniref:Uncharacterized protein n=1 Tax=Clohesyomyces aquaticus TaxID=1231657 RepID=A0A1Y1YNY5_9PLEO|nr:hypothetical protein BCR34DRAFT_592824 [Clohesyomyces aquaticus]